MHDTASKDLVLFTPELKDPGLSKEDGAFQLEEDKCIHLIVSNLGQQPALSGWRRE